MKKRSKQKKFISISAPILIIAVVLSLAINIVLYEQKKTRLAASVSESVDIAITDQKNSETDQPEEVSSEEDKIRIEIEQLEAEAEKTIAQIEEMRGGKEINRILLNGCITEAEAFYKDEEMSEEAKAELKQKKDECLKKYSVE